MHSAARRDCEDAQSDQQPPEQLQQHIVAREAAFRFSVVRFLAAGGSLERAQELCAEVDAEIDGRITPSRHSWPR